MHPAELHWKAPKRQLQRSDFIVSQSQTPPASLMWREMAEEVQEQKINKGRGEFTEFHDDLLMQTQIPFN